MDNIWVIILPALLAGSIVIQIAAVVFLIWLSWRYFDRRYKTGNKEKSVELLSGTLERTSEVFVDPNDGLTYRVYYNRQTGEREYVRE